MKDFFTNKNTAGMTRREAVLAFIIQWWVEEHEDEIKEVADSCDFGALEKKSDYQIGVMVRAKKNFLIDMYRDVRVIPCLKYGLDLVGCGGFSEKKLAKVPPGFDYNWYTDGASVMRHRLESVIGHMLMESGWWAENENRIRKERRDFRRIREVMNS
jgi:hypothetical protein